MNGQCLSMATCRKEQPEPYNVGLVEIISFLNLMWEWIVSIMSYRSRTVCPKGSTCFIARWISKARVNFKSYWDFSHAKVLCWTVTRWKEVKVMSSLRVYICFSQRSFIIDFNGARPVYPKLKWVGICIHYGPISQFPSVTVYKKHLQYHSTTRLIATSLADYDGFLYHFTCFCSSRDLYALH